MRAVFFFFLFTPFVSFCDVSPNGVPFHATAAHFREATFLRARKEITSLSAAERGRRDVEDRDDVHSVLLTRNDPRQIDGRSQPNGEVISLRALKGIVSETVLAERADIVLKTGKIGLSKEQLITIFRLIEESSLKGGALRYSKKQFPCLIENLRPLHGYVIRKIRSREAFIGRGYFKVVTKAILYGQQPKVLAECSTRSSLRDEIAVLKKVTPSKGIVPYYGAIREGEKRSIFLEYFPQGALAHWFGKNKFFSESQTLKIALDIAQGVQSLHHVKLVHGDLHQGNILLDISDTTCRAAIVDFGRTLSPKRARKVTPQGSPHKCPAEALIISFSKLDRFKVDVYALGCLFYHMVWKKEPPWAGVYNIRRIEKYSTGKRKAFYKKIVALYEKDCGRKIGDLLKKKQENVPLTRIERLQLLTFEMLDVLPKHRPRIDAVVEKLCEP